MKHLFALLLLAAMIGCSPARKGKAINEKVPDIAGTWLENDNAERPCYIVQNDRDLVFLSGNETSAGYFKSSMEVFAKDWNRNAILAQNGQTLRWADRTWTKISFTSPDVSGVWYEDGEAGKRIIITQQGNRLVMDNGTQKLNAYFYTTNGIYSMENNNYGVYSPQQNTLTWGTKIWRRTALK